MFSILKELNPVLLAIIAGTATFIITSLGSSNLIINILDIWSITRNIIDSIIIVVILFSYFHMHVSIA